MPSSRVWMGFLVGLALLPSAWSQKMSPRRNDPLQAILVGKQPRPTPQWPAREPLARWKVYEIYDLEGNRLGRFAPYASTKLPAYLIQDPLGNARSRLLLDRKTKAQWILRGVHNEKRGRLLVMNAGCSEYDWRDFEDSSIAAILWRVGTQHYELRGGDEIRELFESTFKIPLPEPPALRQKLFRALHRAPR